MYRLCIKKDLFHNFVKLTSTSKIVIRSQNVKDRCSVFLDSNNFSSTTSKRTAKDEYKVTFIKANGDRITAKGKEGDSLLDVIVNNNLDFDGFGACEGTLTCSTCHCIFKQEDYDRLPEKPSDEELDMLDLAYELTDTSRLGCQIQLSKDLDGIEVKIPATVNDARS